MKKIRILYATRGVGGPQIVGTPEIVANELLRSLPSDKISVSVLTDRNEKIALPPHVKEIFYVPYPKVPILGRILYSFILSKIIDSYFTVVSYPTPLL